MLLTRCAPAGRTARPEDEQRDGHRAGAAPGTAARRQGAARFAVQAGVVVLAFVLYSAARGFAGTDPGPALDHARDVMALERRLGLFHEQGLQALVAHDSHVLDVLNSVYVWGHWPLITVVLAWLFLRHPGEYLTMRNALLLSCAVALAVYAVYPVAPPRLSDIGLFDSVAARSRAYRVLQPPGFVNQYAALPSMHMGWDLLMALAVLRHARHVAVRLLAVLLPLGMLASIVLTANHWFLDAVAGAVVALCSLAVVQRLVPQGRAVPCPQVPLPRRAP